VTVRSTTYILNCCSVSFDDELEITRRKNSLDTDARPGRLRCLKAAVILAMTTSRHMTLKGMMMAADDEPPVSRGFVGRRRAPQARFAQPLSATTTTRHASCTIFKITMDSCT